MNNYYNYLKEYEVNNIHHITCKYFRWKPVVQVIVVFFNEWLIDDIADIFRIVKKIEEEILVMYDGYFEIWETKRDKATGASNVVLTFEFNYITEDKKPKNRGELHDDDGLPIF